MQVALDVPDRHLIGSTPEEFGRRLKLYAALLLFQSGELSAGGACELAGVDRFTFLAECDRREIAVIDYPPEELRTEVEGLRQGSG
jgi:predicted HTH domain antitoxin